MLNLGIFFNNVSGMLSFSPKEPGKYQGNCFPPESDLGSSLTDTLKKLFVIFLLNSIK